MAGANLDPFFSIAIASGPMSTPQIITNNPACGPNMIMQTVISQMPPPIVTTQAVPPATLGGSGPSTYNAPPVTHGGSGPSIYTAPPITHGGNGPSMQTIPSTTLGDTGSSTMAPPVPLAMCCRLSHTWVMWQKSSYHSVCPWGQVLSQGCHLILDSSV